ncbi:hypothetical protein BBJ28_00010516 [Nothophytophthora sp. Chile5]|nr:hypothetical protein BBJ28_00010516 [Nothophytophthora sp. Chile5]
MACCCVCMEVEDYNGSVLVQCAKCGIRVHIKCYGVSVTGSGGDMSTWHCQPCEYMMGTATGALKANTTSPPLLAPQCAVCPVAGGALRLTDQRDVWCHVLCLNWIPELSHSMAGQMDEAVEIALLDRSRSSLRCLVCGLRSGCIQCVSGRCARAFHVVCAFRSPSSLIFTGYNNDNQQVYHCKTHLSDVSTRRYEMVDNSWRSLPEVQKFMHDHPLTDGKCRYCSTKVVAATREGHETQCVLGWLSRRDAQRRKEEVDRIGVKPVQIAYARKKAKSPSKVVGGKNRSKSSPIARKDRLDEDHLSGDGLSSARSGKQKRQPVPMRPCPECGESVRETLMMGHLKNNCPRSRQTDARGSKLKRKTQMPPRSIGGDVFRDEVEVADLSDVLFASWPGQTSGGPMDSTYFWKVVGSHFFSSKVLAKKRMEQLCKSLCGVKLEDIAKSSRRRHLQSTDIHCRDTVRLERNTEDPRQPLVLQKVTHRCDFLMRASHSRCMSDSFAKPMLEIRHNPQRAEYANGVSYETILEDAKAEIRVLFTGMDNRSVSCKYTMHVSRNGTIMAQHTADDGTVASSFQHDAISSLAGFDMQTKKLSLPKEDQLLISLDACDQMDAVVDGVLLVEGLAGTARPELTDELTPVINLLMEHLKDKMEQNRYNFRTLSKKLQTKERKEEQLQLRARTTELFYREFSSWKRLCASLLIGYKTASQGEEDAKAIKTEEEETRAAEGEDDDAIDDGTCVVCFDGQSPETNPIVFCDRCELAVHQRCYGIAKVPSSEFICDRCRVEREGLDPVADVFCQLCSLGDGAFKRTVDGKWVHVVCALWCPKVWIGNLFELSEISLVGNANQTRFVDTVTEIEARIAQATVAQPTSHKNGETSSHEQAQALQLGSLCMHCRVACGRTIQCCHSGCTASFHPLCGWFDGLPMTTSLGDRGYMYAGGGAGLNFQMFCASHLPDHYPASERLSQRRRRSRFRIDSYFVIRNKANYSSGARKQGDSESSLLSGAIVQALITAENKMSATGDDDPQATDWTDMAVCSACFEYCAPVVGELTDVNMLHRRQFMIRCQYCNVYIHPECCISDIGSSPTIFRSNWICERCTQTGDKEAPECVACAKSTDYLMPCVDPPAAPTPVALQAVPDARPLGLAIRPAPGGGQQLWLEAHQKMQRQQQQQQQQLQHQVEKPLPQNGQQLVQGSNGTATPPASSKWIHVYCSKWKKTKTLKRHHMLWAYPPASNTDGIATRCELCSRKDGTLASCAKCPRRFHPLCAAKKKLYCARSNRVEWKFYCEAHPPADAAFDENRQSWITQEMLSQLQDLRRSLERGRMLLEMSRQRDRQQKRLLNLCKLPLMKASIDVILKKRPSAQMKEVYFDLTGDTLTDAVARPKPTPPSPRTSGSRTRPKRSASSSSSMDQERRAPQRSSPRVAAAARPTRSSLKRSGAATATPERSSKRRRLRSDSDVSTTTDRNVRRSSRRKSLRYSQTPSDDEDMEDGEENDSTTEKLALAAQKRFLACLVVPKNPTDFDLVIPQQFPALVGMRS